MKIQKEHLEHHFAAKEKDRYALNGCIFTPYGVVTTDGRRLHETKHHRDVWIDNDCSAVYDDDSEDSDKPIFPVNDALVKAFLKLCKPLIRGGPAFCMIRYNALTKYFHLESEHGPQMGIPAIEGQYPDYKSILPKRGGIQLAFDAKYLKDTAHLFCKTDGTSVEHSALAFDIRADEMLDIDRELDGLNKLFPSKKESAGKDTIVKVRKSIEALQQTQNQMRGENNHGVHIEQNGHYSLLMPCDLGERNKESFGKPNLGVMTEKKRVDATNAMRLACGLITKSTAQAKADVAVKRSARKKAAEAPSTKGITAKVRAAEAKAVAKGKAEKTERMTVAEIISDTEAKAIGQGKKRTKKTEPVAA